VQVLGLIYRGENSHIEALNFSPIFIPLDECKVSGVSVQDMLLCLPFLTPETRHLSTIPSEAKRKRGNQIRGTETV
jgi:hypothetical protein